MSTCHVSIYWSDHKINNLKVNAGTWTYSNCAIVKKNNYILSALKDTKSKKTTCKLKEKKTACVTVYDNFIIKIHIRKYKIHIQ